jgi:hypothetical protein
MREPSISSFPLPAFAGTGSRESTVFRQTTLGPRFPEDDESFAEAINIFVIPAKAGIHVATVKVKMGPRFRGDDGYRYEPGSSVKDRPD